MNREIADVFQEMARLLEIKEGNPFRIRSFERAAQIIEDLPEEVEDLLKEHPKKLESISGIGPGTISRIHEIVQTGACRDLEDLRAEVPPSLLQLLELQNLGPRKVYRLWKELGITNLVELEKALEAGKVQRISGMGEKSAEKLQESIRRYRRRTGRFRLDHALQASRSILEHVQKSGLAERTACAGSLRRRRETVGDIDILATSEQPEALIAEFLEHPSIREVTAHGATKVSVRLKQGLACDLRVVEPDAFGAALQYFTGSKDHNVALRERAKRQGFKISEYGLFSVESGQRIEGADEEKIYRRLGLQCPPPELRENRGEIEAAEEGKAPRLITLENLRGDLHLHTTDSDGKNSLQEMAEAARRRGYRYAAITDHSQALAMTQGLDADGLRRQAEAVRRFNKNDPGITLLSGIEVDILPDGDLDLDENALSEVDVVIAAVHSALHQDREEMTRRVLRALAHPQVNILAHPTGRILLKRDACELDLEAVFETARKHGVALELNAHPKRLDLSDVACRSARRHGVPISVNSDSHNREALHLVEYGIYTARRGWLTAEDVLNCRPLEKLMKFLKKEESGR